MIINIKELIGFRRFLKIKNLDFESSKVVIFFGENGSGKTTLSRLLKFLDEEDTDRLRKLKHDNGKVLKAIIECAESQVKCIPKDDEGNIKLDGKFPFKVEVFNIDFVNENIYLGNKVDADIKNNLFKFVFGKHQVNIQKKLDEITNKIREIDKNIKEKKQEIIKSAQIREYEFEDFINLNANESLDSLKSEKVKLEKSLKDQERKCEIKKLDMLSELNLSSLNSLIKELKDVCRTSLSELEEKAKGRFEKHLRIIGKKEKDWLRKGLEIKQFMKENICPFCGQELNDSSLIKEYEVIFNEEYVKLIEQIEKLSKEINKFSLSYIIKNISNNDNLIQKWTQYIENLEIPRIEKIETIEEKIKTEFESILNSKREKIFISLNSFEKLDEKINELKEIITSYNSHVKNINQKIERFKQQLEIDNIDKMIKELKSIEEKIRRKGLNDVCNKYKELLQEKENLEEEKRNLETQLNEEMDKFLRKYDEEINKIFEKFNTDYRIEPKKIKTTRKQQTFEYAIKLNFSEDVKPNTRLGEILSEGDKTTLAFSVFIAKQKLDNDLDKKVIVIDDPISSLDEFRIFRTVEYIIDMIERSKQIIILTHNLLFLNVLLEKLERLGFSNTSVCQIEKSVDSSIIKKLTIGEARNIIEHKLNSYYERLENVKNLIREYDNAEFLEDTQINNAFDDGRVALESYLRFKFPEDKFSPIGTIIRKIKEKNSEKGRFLANLHDVLSKNHHQSSVNLSRNEKISYLRELINFIENEEVS